MTISHKWRDDIEQMAAPIIGTDAEQRAGDRVMALLFIGALLVATASIGLSGIIND